MEGNYWQQRSRRPISRRKLISGLATAGAAGLFVACGGSTGGSNTPQATSQAGSGTATAPLLNPKRDGTLRIAAIAADEPRGGFDPHTGFGAEEFQWDYLVFDQLIGYDRAAKLDGSLGLAEAWEIPDPLQVVLKIRQGVTFHDGTPFSAADVKWNLDRILDPATKATPAPDISSIDSVQVVSPTEVVLHLKAPSAPLLSALGDRAGMMLSPTAFTKLGKDKFLRQPSGTGQFTLQQWTSAANMTLQRNPTYWRKDAQGNVLPYLKTINVQFIPEATVQTATMESGQADMLSRTPALDSPRLNKDSNYQSTRYVGAVTGMFYINHALPPMDNVMFRRAFASALDIPSYVKNYLLGVEPLAKGLLTPGSWAYDDAIQGYPYDLAKAKQYLAASGLPQSQWTVVGGFVPATEQGQFWEASLKGAGITLKWNPVPAGGTQRHLYVNQGDDPIIQATASTWSVRVDPDGSIGQFYTQKAAYNAGAGAVPEIEQLVQQARQTYDQAQRKQMYFDIQAKAVDQVYSCTPTYYGINQATAVKAVGNLENLYGGEGRPRYASLWI